MPKTPVLPVHAIKPPELASQDLKLPKIPKKQTGPAIQIQSAEILETKEQIPEVLQIESVIASPETIVVSDNAIPLSIEALKQAFAEFAAKQKLSLVALIKLLEPTFIDLDVFVKMSKQQEELIGETKVEWQAYLRQYFRQNNLQLQIKIDDSVVMQTLAYTPSEQYTELANESEAFRDLVNQLKLKIKHS